MGLELQRAYDFIEAANAAPTLDAFGLIYTRTLENFGVPHHALAVMLRPAEGAPRQFTPLTNGVTEAWSRHYWEQSYFNVDAAVHVALQQYAPFSWSEIEAQPLTRSSARLFHEIRDALPVDGGFVVPMHDAGGFAGLSALFCEDAELAPEVRDALKLISVVGAERGKQLYLQGPMAIAKLCPLSPRQREVLAYAAQGKSENDTADILGLSSATVREHLAKARDAMGVRTKMQAVAIAVQRGWIAL